MLKSYLGSVEDDMMEIEGRVTHNPILSYRRAPSENAGPWPCATAFSASACQKPETEKTETYSHSFSTLTSPHIQKVFLFLRKIQPCFPSLELVH
jgi:hypothetical protein